MDGMGKVLNFDPWKRTRIPLSFQKTAGSDTQLHGGRALEKVEVPPAWKRHMAHFWGINSLHPGRLTWFTYKSPMKRKENDLNQTSMVMFHVNLQGCRFLGKNPSFGRFFSRVDSVDPRTTAMSFSSKLDWTNDKPGSNDTDLSCIRDIYRWFIFMWDICMSYHCIYLSDISVINM